MYNKYAAGAKHYGGGRSAPNIGAVNKSGYRDRSANLAAKARREAIKKRLQKMRTP